ncbi:hypothetical protein V1477_008625 [Vespula maculifrons]|uniref:Uncharacterized protein n=1 Tax=Vespula maculifrons TaxID=7453 RepID=A0ABD2CDK0_VESMC
MTLATTMDKIRTTSAIRVPTTCLSLRHISGVAASKDPWANCDSTLKSNCLDVFKPALASLISFHLSNYEDELKTSFGYNHILIKNSSNQFESIFNNNFNLLHGGYCSVLEPPQNFLNTKDLELFGCLVISILTFALCDF